MVVPLGPTGLPLSTAPWDQEMTADLSLWGASARCLEEATLPSQLATAGKQLPVPEGEAASPRCTFLGAGVSEQPSRECMRACGCGDVYAGSAKLRDRQGHLSLLLLL